MLVYRVAYHEDLKWRMIYQRKMLGLTYQQIAVNLCVDSSTVWRAVKQFDDEGTVAAKKNKGYLIMKSLKLLWRGLPCIGGRSVGIFMMLLV